MYLIYLHGFRSHANAIKGSWLKAYCQQHHPEIQVYIPDLNRPPCEVMQLLSAQIAAHSQVALVGSSLGGFYATQLVVKHHVPAVLINPVVQPWQVFDQLFHGQLPLQVTADWCLDARQLEDLRQMATPCLEAAHQLLVLLKQGDEILDYRVAQRYYSQAASGVSMITEPGGDHFMADFREKIPMLLQFLSARLD